MRVNLRLTFSDFFSGSSNQPMVDMTSFSGGVMMNNRHSYEGSEVHKNQDFAKSYILPNNSQVCIRNSSSNTVANISMLSSKSEDSARSSCAPFLGHLSTDEAQSHVSLRALISRSMARSYRLPTHPKFKESI